MANKSNLEGPHEPCQFKPDGAEKMPTKHYPESTNMATKGKKTSMDGPCEGKDLYHK
jgi:hypothetical protein